MSTTTGIGWDSHRLVAGRPLILGGVTIPHPEGLAGHSDADVLTHAVIDALLGAAALGDIGRHFPDTDPRYAGADSLGLLRTALGAVGTEGCAVAHVDATVVMERPKLAPHRDAIRDTLAASWASTAPRQRQGLHGRGHGLRGARRGRRGAGRGAHCVAAGRSGGPDAVFGPGPPACAGAAGPCSLPARVHARASGLSPRPDTVPPLLSAGPRLRSCGQGRSRCWSCLVVTGSPWPSWPRGDRGMRAGTSCWGPCVPTALYRAANASRGPPRRSCDRRGRGAGQRDRADAFSTLARRWSRGASSLAAPAGTSSWAPPAA